MHGIACVFRSYNVFCRNLDCPNLQIRYHDQSYEKHFLSVSNRYNCFHMYLLVYIDPSTEDSETNIMSLFGVHVI